MQYLVIIERCSTGFSAYVPDLPGCVAAGDTRDEVTHLMHEAIELHLSDMRETGQTIPEPMTSSELVAVAA